MKEEILELKKKRCVKCGWEWIPRTDNPAECPACKNRNWQEEKKRKQK
jgi:predicted Zn-ribbon and HTH transcriptional regulator